MPPFSAINLEPEENIDDEVDTTRELHIDEALKRFQTALKLHAQGPRHYEDAKVAYESLFESDIFQYPESATEFERTERQSDSRHLPLDASLAQSLDDAQADIDGSGSSLPQTLYLAYKNHGQFALDRIRHQTKTREGDAVSILADAKVLALAQKALYEFSAALDHDPSDAELWRRAARVAAFLSSARISRYCLEAAIELDDDPAIDEVEPPSLAEGFAGEQLKAQLGVLADDLSLTHPIMVPFLKRSLPGPLKKYLDPFPFLPNPTHALAQPKTALDQQEPRRLIIHVPLPSWTDLGMALVHRVAADGPGGEAITIDIPVVPEGPDDMQMLVERPKPQTTEEPISVPTAVEAEPPAPLKDDQLESPIEGNAENENLSEEVAVERSESVLSRKRSQSAAGFPEGMDQDVIDQKRSKRIRRRETAAGDSIDTNTLLAAQLQPFQAADQNLFQMTRNMVENLGVTDRDTLDRLAEVLDSCASDTRTAKLTRSSMVDLRDSLTKFSEENTKAILGKKETPPIGFSSFLEHSKPGSQNKPLTPMFHETRGLHDFVEKVNDDWICIQDAAFEWVKHVCATYLTSKWSDSMKTAVVQVISHMDEDIYLRVQHELSRSESGQSSPQVLDMIDQTVQMLFELHLDVYERITNPNSAVDFAIRVETKGRMGRWFALAARMSRDRPQRADNSISIRFLWSAVFAVTLTEGVSRDHILQCWKSLRDRLGEEQTAIDLQLPNNAIMPEVSAHAADREISKLTTMDFFLGLFQNDMKDPISVIESLEPVLNPSSVHSTIGPTEPSDAIAVDEHLAPATPDQDTMPILETASQGLQDLWKFLLGTSTELRLFLWTRLGDAYEAINYKTKQFSCLLKSIEMVVGDFERDAYLNVSAEIRRPLFLKMLRFLDELLIKSLSSALNDSHAFDIVDDDHLKSSISTLTKLSCILHVSCMYEDEVRVGMAQHRSNGATFQSYLTKLREMQVRNWSLLYTLLKAGIAQNKSGFTTPENDLADYLAAVHQVLGLRKFCKASNRIFLKMMRVELLKQNMIDNWEDYLGQVLYDLYGLKLGVGLSEVQDHGCPPENLERRNTTALVERVAILANRIPMKDLLKSDLKNTIEHMQQAIGQTKSNQQLIHNLRIYTQTLQRAIDPLELYKAFKGDVAIDAVEVHTADSALAKHRWFFLLGMIAFTKFKGVDLNRRQTPGATDDLRIGATFLRQQLQFTPDQWDAWFRLAECFDYELDESVLWTADKMNKERAELVKYQRNAIHCYTLALSHSHTALFDTHEESLDAIHDLYHKFGMRMYASSREPFAMEPFSSESKRFYIHETGADTRELHPKMQDYKVWRYASRLFRKAMEVKPTQWKNSYMYAKCIWKMYQKPLTSLGHQDRRDRPTVQVVINTLERAVEVVSALPKPRGSQDPILEPHYKIVSIVHKLVGVGDLGLQEGADILQRQPYAIRDGEHVDIGDAEDWESYVIQTLTHLREKDRSNWQHRIIMRHARILFDEDSDESGYVQAMAAFGVLKESMLTKTMVMNVWKTDAERPGRHHVYTEQYVRFVVKLLVVLKDRTNFEALLRRLRKKGADFYHFNDLWQTCCVAYLRLIRQTYQISPVLEDDFKVTSPEEFEIVTARISDWSSDPEISHPGLSALQETVELKKLNSGLMKAGAIDDLISDCYTAMYFEIGKSLPGPAVATLIAEREQARLREEAGHSGKVPNGKPANPFTSILNPQSVENSGAEGAPGESTPANIEGAQRPRKTGIRRADVLRKAEQAVLRAQEGPKPKLRRSVSSHQTPTADEGNDGEAIGDAGSDKGEHDDDVEMRDEEADHESSDRESSVPGSVHDSADDESDLSDVPAEDLLDEDEAQRLMFPNLIQRSQHPDSDESDDTEPDEVDSTIEEAEE
ncbi:Uu.00g007830.m01.CDS01 [Anthostomella pinea]|uniref:Histone transcription regulator 3 homolog n=1 Tax=Anthostomella pinea TaxID=933095 RepID=A0AAI8YPR0_9PEZI|nr:Uu.00g007830.m01.CDS01 [Anthostomella pinea]